MKKLSFTQKIIIGAALGILAGMFVPQYVPYVKFLGDVFLRLVKVVVPLLVFCAIVDAVASIDLKDIGKVGAKTLSLFLLTTSCAAALALVFVFLFKPTQVVAGAATEYTGGAVPQSFVDLLVTFIPSNIVSSFANGTIIQIIVFGIFLGLAISKHKSDPLVASFYDTIKGLRALMMSIVTMFMVLAPYGIFSLIANTVGTIDSTKLVQVLQFVVTVTAANIVYMILYTLIVGFVCKLNPIRLVQNLSRTYIMGVSTQSSAMTLPTELMDAKERLGISDRIAEFVLPLGNAINTNGAAVTTIIAGVTCAHIFGLNWGMQQYIMLAIYSVIATYGNTTVPGGGIVAVAVVFEMAGLPLEGVALFVSVDFFTSLTRIILNVVSDVYVAVIVAHSENELDRDVFYGRKQVGENLMP